MNNADGKLSVNPETLASLDELQEPGQPDFLVELIDSYLAEAPARLASIEAGIGSQDWIKAARACHLLKGSSSNMGADGLSRLCKDLEIKAMTDQIGSIPDAWARLNEEFLVVSREFRAIAAARR